MKKEIVEKHKSGFSVEHPKESMFGEEWLFDIKRSNDNKIIFLGYDANLFPLPNFSTWPETDWKKKVIGIALKRTEDFKGEIWLDDVKIKECEKNEYDNQSRKTN